MVTKSTQTLLCFRLAFGLVTIFGKASALSHKLGPSLRVTHRRFSLFRNWQVTSAIILLTSTGIPGVASAQAVFFHTDSPPGDRQAFSLAPLLCIERRPTSYWELAKSNSSTLISSIKAQRDPNGQWLDCNLSARACFRR